MKKVLLIGTLLLALVFLLTSCGSEDVPKGFQLASNPSDDGFSLYIPQDWLYNHASGVVTAYMSNVTTGTVTVTHLSCSDATIGDFFAGQETELQSTFLNYTLDSTIDKNNPPKKEIDGHNAFIYSFTGSYGGKSYQFDQYFIQKGESISDGFILLSFTASNVPNEYTETVDYEEVKEYFDKVVEYFKVGIQTTNKTDLGVVEKDTPSGMKLATTLSSYGMKFYVPENWDVVLSSGFVQAVAPDRSTLSIQEYDYSDTVTGMKKYNIPYYDEENGVTLIDFWNLLKAQYDEYLDNFTVLVESIGVDSEGVSLVNPQTAGETTYYKCTFTGEKNGVTYQFSTYVMRKTAATLRNSFYLLTFTSTPSNFDSHQAEILTMLEKVKY